MNRNAILECVPNFSEGASQLTINAIAEAIKATAGAHLLHIDTSPAANRTVMTFAGAPEAVVEAAFSAIKTAAARIDMRLQQGIHPRIGATDVCPLIPLYDMDMEEAIQWSKKLGERVGKELNIPVYLYEHSAAQPYRRALPAIRRGQYEGFADKIKDEKWRPDYGPSAFNAGTGATVIGARDILVAFNISLATKDEAKAQYIAERMRESGYRDAKTNSKVPGLLPKLRAIGWYSTDFECAQVSMNLLDYRITSPLKVWNTCKALAQELDIELIGSEVVGLIPEICLVEAGQYAYIQKQQTTPEDNKQLVEKAIEYMGMDKVKPFDPQEKILEYALKNAGLI
jgi:glutamate formiminotransferase/formiminotetrahydrofolate cyclodeaminase